MNNQNWPVFKAGDVVELADDQCKDPDVLHYCKPGDKYVVQKFDSYMHLVTFKDKTGSQVAFNSYRFKLSEKTYPFGQDPNKKYTYNGFPARLICTDRVDSQNKYTYLWLYSKENGEFLVTTDVIGTEVHGGKISEVQSKPETDWSKVPVDTLVYIQNKKLKTTYKRYFAGLDSKLSCTIFQWGTTSATSENKPAPLNSDCEISLKPFND